MKSDSGTTDSRTASAEAPGTHRDWGFQSSTGQDFTHTSIVDIHFAACQDGYRTSLDRVGIPPGAHVLDAGCGSGSFLPWIAAAVGPEGRVAALDLAEEHVAASRDRVRRASLPCPVEVRRGTVLDLPYPDDTFDIVWCSNTTQYLDDQELLKALHEMRRVVRPAGLVAIKEMDPTTIAIRPGDPFLLTDFFRMEGREDGYSRQLLRSRDLYQWMGRAGLVNIRQRTQLIEHFAPFEPVVRGFYSLACQQLAQRAMSISAGAAWRRFLNPDDPENPLNDPRAYTVEGCVIAVGMVP
jgi:ubiquinone/menaquinone biosynthesis C-methylase UbiE